MVDSLKKVENEKWGKKIYCYDQLWLYKHVIKELAPNMWLRMGLDNTKMAADQGRQSWGGWGGTRPPPIFRVGGTNI